MFYLQGLEKVKEKACGMHYQGLKTKLCRTQPEAVPLHRGIFPN